MGPERRRRYLILDVEIDAASHVVRRGTAAHHLRAQSMAVLLYLLEHRDRLVSKEELLSAVWRDVAVTDEALTQCIKEIRRALGDDHRSPRFIRTVPKVGYQVIATVSDPVAESPQISASVVSEANVVVAPSGAHRGLGPAASIAALLAGTGVVWGLWAVSGPRAETPASPMTTARPPSAAPAVLTNNAGAYDAYRAGLEHAIALRGESALESFQRAVDLDPEFAMAHGRLGFTYAFILGGATQAQKHLETALVFEKRLTDFDRQLLQAWYAVARMDFGSAISLYQEVVRQRPEDAEGHARLSKLLAGEERFEEALVSLRSGLAIAPRSREMLNELCLVLSDLRRHDEAISTCRQLVDVDPRLANSHDSLGMVLDAAGDAAGALAAYDRAIELDPSFEVAVIHRGNLFYRQGQFARAIRDFERYLTIAPALHHSRGNEVLALTWWRLGDRQRADEYLAAAQRLSPHQDVTAIAMLIASASRDEVIKLAGGLPYQALPTRGFRMSPRIEAARQGRYALAAGRGDEALRWFRQALSHRPVTWNVEWYDDCVADALLQLGRVDEAITEYQRVLRERPGLALTHYHVAQAYDRKGDTRSARRHYARFLESWRDADANGLEVTAARQRLATIRTF